ncbi:MAG: PorV/PorQ family protein [Ignavibacterium album]|uniref:PorV/PorQ family protein n=1 Tax=Ignavibacterium album TaxID=591197 RepID=UPI0026EDEA69|nr:PorV/PorQ family protein [Ignavibacterium album]MCX8106719.1 PorV/PorQ family protein [Ignavibacterium album]
MKKNKLTTLIILIISVLTLSLRINAQGVNYVGTSVANFLKIGLSAKSVAVAEADITIADDASTLYLNPGSVSWLEKSSATFSYVQWLVQTNLSYFSIVLPTDYGNLGFDIAYFGSGDIKETTLLRQEGTGRVVSASDLSIGLVYAKNLTDRFSFGLKLKYLSENLASVSASTFAFDIGSVFVTSFLNNMKIGITLSNFGGSLRFEGNDLLVTQVVPGSTTNKQVPAILQTNSWNLPLLFRIGISTTALELDNYKLAINYLIVDSRDYDVRHNVGASFNIYDLVTLRGGYRFNYDEATFSAGIGIKTKTDFIGDLSLDYAYTDFGRLNGINQFTLSINF